MFSRKAICLWLLGASVCVALAAGGAGVAQQPGPGSSAADPSLVPAPGAFSVAQAGGGTGGGGAAVTEAPFSKPSRRQPASPGGYSPGSYSGPPDVYGVPAGRVQGSVGPSYYAYARGKGRKPDPEMEKLLEQDAKMEQQARNFVKRYREAEDQQEQARSRANLEVLTKEHFDLRQKRRELEISRLEAQLERVRASIKKRNEVKDLIIQRRIARLLDEEDDLAF